MLPRRGLPLATAKAKANRAAEALPVLESAAPIVAKLRDEGASLREIADECVTLTRTQRHLPTEAVQMMAMPPAPVDVMGDPGQLRGAVLNSFSVSCASDLCPITNATSQT